MEFVFYRRDAKSHDYGHNCDGQAGGIGGLAATRELSAGTFRHLHDAVDRGISFLLFVDTGGGVCRDDNARGAFAAFTSIRIPTTEFTEGTERKNRE